MRIPTVVAVLVCVAGCNPTTPGGYPVVRGTYEGQLGIEFTSVPAGVRSSGGPCQVTLTVATQNDAAFDGQLARGHPCVRATLPLRGMVEKSGRVVVDVTGGDGFQGFHRCRYVTGDQRWRGEIRGDDLELAIDLLMDCDDTGPIQTRGTLTALLVPRSR